MNGEREEKGKEKRKNKRKKGLSQNNFCFSK